LTLGWTAPETTSSTNLPIFFSERSEAEPWEAKGNFWFFAESWMAKAGHVPTSRFRLPACWPKALASMVAKLSFPLCFSATGFRVLASASRSAGNSAKI